MCLASAPGAWPPGPVQGLIKGDPRPPRLRAAGERKGSERKLLMNVKPCSEPSQPSSTDLKDLNWESLKLSQTHQGLA